MTIRRDFGEDKNNNKNSNNNNILMSATCLAERHGFLPVYSTDWTVDSALAYSLYLRFLLNLLVEASQATLESLTVIRSFGGLSNLIAL